MIKRFIVLGIILFGRLISVDAPLTGQVPQPVPVPTLRPYVLRPFSDLTLEISSRGARLRLEPVPVILKLKNLTDSDVLGYTSMGLEGYPLAVYTRRVGASERIKVKRLGLLSGLTGVPHSPVPSGSVYEGKEWLTLSLDQYFSEPGSYELQVRVFSFDSTQFVDSNTITIEIKEPIGLDRAAYNLVRSSSVSDVLFAGAEFNRVEPVLHQLSTLYPASPYGKAASFALGNAYFQARNFPMALLYLNRVRGDTSFIHSDRIQKILAEITRISAAT